VNDESLVLGWRDGLDGIHGGSARTLTVRLERVENSDNGVAVFRKGLLGHLHIHLGTMLLQAELRVLFEPPGCDLSLADAAEDRQRWGMVAGVVGTLLREPGQIMSQHLCPDAQRLYQELWQVNGHLAENRGAHHPHGLQRVSGGPIGGVGHPYVALFSCGAVVDHDALRLEVQHLFVVVVVFVIGVGAMGVIDAVGG